MILLATIMISISIRAAKSYDCGVYSYGQLVDCNKDCKMGADRMCYSVCPHGSIDIQMKENSYNCQPCTAPCETCKDELTSCLSCSTGYLFGQECLTSCPIGYYGDKFFKKCMLCHESCLSCSNRGIYSCLTCNASLNLFLNSEHRCENCANNTFSNGHLCINCTTSCSECTSLEFCNSCVLDYFLFNNTCITETECLEMPDMFADNQLCYSCHSSCRNSTSCIGPGIDNCTSCPDSSFFFNGTCYTTCPDGTFPNSTDSLCMPCLENCATCKSANSNDCLSCTNKYFFIQTSIEDKTGNCNPTCPAGTWGDSLSNACNPCHQDCLECYGGALNTCTKCGDGLYLLKNECLKECPTKMWANTANNTCTQCNSPCLECEGGTQDTCVSCLTGFFLSGNTCAIGCSDGYWEDSDNKKCQPCHSDCRTCRGKSEFSCTSCNPSSPQKSVFSMGICSDSCVEGTYISNDPVNPTLKLCSSCSSECRTCATNTTCLTCHQNWIFHNDSCLTSCPSGYVQDKFTCQKCDISCGTCMMNPTFCVACSKNNSPYNYLENFKCIEECPLGKTPISGICRDCDETICDYIYYEFSRDNTIDSKILKDDDMEALLVTLKYKNGTFFDPTHFIDNQINNFKMLLSGIELDLRVSIIKGRIIAVYKIGDTSRLVKGKRIVISIRVYDPILKVAPKYKLLSDKSQTIDLILPMLEKEQSKAIQENTQTAASIGKITAKALEIGSFLALLFAVDPSGSTMALSQQTKLISRLGLMSVRFGSVLDPYIIQIAQSFSMSQNVNLEELVRKENGDKRKVSKASISLDFIKVLSYKLILYPLSILLNFLGDRYGASLINNRNSITPWKVKIIHGFRILHFTSLNMIVDDGVFIASRTILHSADISLNYIAAVVFFAIFSFDLTRLVFKNINIRAFKTSKYNRLRNQKKHRDSIISIIELHIGKRQIDNRWEDDSQIDDIGSTSKFEKSIPLPEFIPEGWIDKKDALFLGYDLLPCNDHMVDVLSEDLVIKNYVLFGLTDQQMRPILMLKPTSINFTFLLRTLILQAFVISLTYAPIILLTIGLILEFYLLLVLIFAATKGYISSLTYLLKKIVSSLYLLIFFFFSSLVYLNYLESEDDIPLETQIIGMGLLVVGFGVESILYLFVIISGIFYLLNSLLSSTFFLPLEYWRTSPVVYYWTKKDSKEGTSSPEQKTSDFNLIDSQIEGNKKNALDRRRVAVTNMKQNQVYNQQRNRGQ